MKAQKDKINNIFLTGFFGAGNVGDEAVALAVYNGIKNIYPTSSVSIVTRSAEYTKTFTGIQDADFCEGFFPSIDYFKNLAYHIKKIMRSDLIIIGGGGLLQDVHSWTTITTHLLPACIGLIFNKRIATVGIGVGPIQRGWLKKLVAFTLNHIDLIQVRDMHSSNVLVECGVKPSKITITADVVPSLDLKSLIYTKKTVQNESIITPSTVGIAFRKWDGIDETGLIGLCQKLLNHNIKIKFLCYETKSDALFYKSIINELQWNNEDLEIHYPKNLQDAISTLNSCDFILSMRLHGCVFASAMGKNYYAFPYDSKVNEFAERVSNQDRVCSLNNISPDLADSISETVIGKMELSKPNEGFVKEKNLSRLNFSNLEKIETKGTSLYVKFISIFWIGFLIFKSILMFINRFLKFIFKKIKIIK